MYECHPAVCPAGEKCQNQRFQKRDYPDSEPYKVTAKGWGLKTNVPIKKVIYLLSIVFFEGKEVDFMERLQF